MNNREIKFRALKKDINSFKTEWVYYSTDELIPKSKFKNERIIVKDLQYTGRKDKNGKEIYEGDKINHEQYQTPLVVQWDYDQWGLFDGINNEANIDENVKIIGNIFENSNLVK